MGREIRRVPPNWEHPKYTKDSAGGHPSNIGKDRPCFDKDFVTACAKWLSGLAEWKPEENNGYQYWEGWSEPPDRDSYRKPFTEEPTWFQAYETVSEGTPVTPSFATEAELVDYLVEYGDYWYQKDAREGGRGFRTKPSREQAMAFVSGGYTPSMTVEITDGVATIKSNYETL